ncbi:hypothetical protein HRD49_02725 [Corallococcus exiguus]|uniref:hypothetical protein n=1 Tax=Corallococcus TaxID=83461 RepID=UPI000EA2CB8F|nr:MULTISPECIES: hypothetical protein [Corallococcus]NNC17952.1 hypothetical protein [Corallococcus exiguus]NRD58454.1 hypothetical protein [Corallococcus exiguus]NRD60655.1 hypothetical protein [Corallococcus exiguus]RKH23731.1 hypothetical protein D7V77_23060 [Corallococcus sp. CA041A]RUO89923.1 hypothetical protein D7Y11_27705 [Corallococcus sp. AB018]
MARLNSYEEIVEDYQWGPRLKSMGELEYFAKLPSLEEAIEVVADARKENGALFNHQRHLEQSTVDEVRRVLIANQEAIRQVPNFDELFALLERLLTPIRGAKEMYIYDAALRLGSYLKKMPERVYLHMGTRIGAAALGIAVAERAWIAVEELPSAFGTLNAYEIEDALCLYKEELKRITGRLKQRLR